ncbi:hypothetical protein WN943_015934 [Citrus x changshan-huyou]
MSIVGETILTVTIEMLVEKLISDVIQLFARQEQIQAALKDWKKKLRMIRAVLDEMKQSVSNLYGFLKELKLTAAEAEIYIADRDPYKGSLKYYQRLSNRYDARNFDLAVGENQKKKPFIPIVCINLLRNAEGKSESILVQHFEESLNYVMLNQNRVKTLIDQEEEKLSLE